VRERLSGFFGIAGEKDPRVEGRETDDMGKSASEKRLLGKVAVVTGAGQGIGRDEALLLAHEGAKVVVNDLGGDVFGTGANQSLAQKVVEEIRAAGGEAVANTDSVATMEGGRRIIQTALDAFGRLDILLNNAGILRPKLIYEMTEEDWDTVIAVHLKGHFTTTRHAAPIFKEQRSGVILNTASESGLGHYGMSNYSAAKEGIIGFTRTIARDLGQFNVRCNAIRPVAMTRTAVPEVLTMNRISEKELGIPCLGKRWLVQREGDYSPRQVAVCAVWLCTDAAANVNGRTFQVGGSEIGLYSDPEMIRSSYNPAGLELDLLDRMGPYLIGDLENLFSPRKEQETPMK
jgi:3-oxoacyl-[acyl-carrier protein] reductase